MADRARTHAATEDGEHRPLSQGRRASVAQKRASVLMPVPVTEFEAVNIPPPPPIESRPRNASDENLQLEEDAKIEAIAERLNELSSHNTNAFATGGGAENGDDIPPPPPPPPPIPASSELEPPPANHQRPAAAPAPAAAAQPALKRDLKARLSVLDTKSAPPVRPRVMKQSSLSGLPRHGVDLAPPDLYHGLNLNGVTADRLASMMESTLMSNASVTRAFLTWNPQKDDVVVCSTPRCGQQLIVKMLKLLAAETEEDFEDIAEDDFVAVPWVECKLTDENPNVLMEPQTGRFRVMRTCQSYAQLSSKIARSGARFIAVVRNPYDLRRAWATYLRDFYISSGGPNAAREFDERFKLDDFALVPLTVIEAAKKVKEGEYEVAMCDWLKAGEKMPGKVLVILIEEAVAKPDVVLDKLVRFLGIEEPTMMRRSHILEYVSGPRAAEMNKRKGSMTFTPSQLRMIDMKFNDSPDPTLLMPKMASSFAITQQHGVFANDGEGDLASGQDFTPLGLRRIEDVFNKAVVIPYLNDVAGDYKTVYLRVTGSPYPEPLVVVERTSTLTSKIRSSVVGVGLRIAASSTDVRDFANSLRGDNDCVAEDNEVAEGEDEGEGDEDDAPGTPQAKSGMAKASPRPSPSGTAHRSLGGEPSSGKIMGSPKSSRADALADTEPSSPTTPGGTRRTLVGRIFGKKT